MDKIETFLQEQGIKKDHVIYNMHNPTNPRIDLIKLLNEFKNI